MFGLFRKNNFFFLVKFITNNRLIFFLINNTKKIFIYMYIIPNVRYSRIYIDILFEDIRRDIERERTPPTKYPILYIILRP